MNISGICYIAKKYKSDEIDFTRHDNNAYAKMRAEGKICWRDSMKDKSGNEVKTYTYKRFICFDATVIDILDACKKDIILIEGRLRTEEYLDKEGNKKKLEKVIINKAKRYEKQPEIKQPVEKEPVSQDSNDEDFDDVPF